MRLTREEIERRLELIPDGWSPLPDNMQPYLAALFWENRFSSRASERGLTPIYNLTRRDDEENGTLSLYQLYMQCATEYEAALVLIGSLSAWNDLCKMAWFICHVERWREEMLVRDAAIGRSAILRAAANGNHQAGKLLTDTVPKSSRGKGRPVNKESHGDSKMDELVSGVLQRAAQITGGLSDNGRKR